MDGVEAIPHVEGTYLREVVVQCIGESEVLALANLLEQERASARQAVGIDRSPDPMEHEVATCHHAPAAWQGMVYRSDRTEDCEPLDSARHLADAPTRQRTESPGFLGYGAGETGAVCVAVRHGHTYRCRPTSAQKRTIRRLLPLVLSGRATSAMRLQLGNVLREVALLR